MRFVAMGICLALGIVAGILVGKEIAEVFSDPRWLPYAAGGGVGLAVFAALYFPLLRPIADIVQDRLSALNQSVRATRTGTGLDEIPSHPHGRAAPKLDTCKVCGLPGKQICDACSTKLKDGSRSRPSR